MYKLFRRESTWDACQQFVFGTNLHQILAKLSRAGSGSIVDGESKVSASENAPDLVKKRAIIEGGHFDGMEVGTRNGVPSWFFKSRQEVEDYFNCSSYHPRDTTVPMCLALYDVQKFRKFPPLISFLREWSGSLLSHDNIVKFDTAFATTYGSVQYYGLKMPRCKCDLEDYRYMLMKEDATRVNDYGRYSVDHRNDQWANEFPSLYLDVRQAVAHLRSRNFVEKTI